MKKIFFNLAIIVSCLFILSACSSDSTSSNSSKETSNLNGVWTYEEPTGQDPTLIVTLELTSDNTFEVQVTKNALEDNLENTTSVVSGTYKENDDNLELTIDSVEGNNNLVKQGDTVTLSTTQSGDSETLTITDGQLINSDIPETIELIKNNDSN